MTLSFESAYKALEAAKAAAEKAAQRGLETGDPKVLDLARENLDRGTEDFRKMLERDTVVIDAEKGALRLFRAEFAALEKLAKDNNRNVSEFRNRVTVENGRVVRAELDNLKLTNISALSGLPELIELVLFHNKIVDISPLAHLTKLRQLSLGSNQIVDFSPVAQLIDLKSLWADTNPVRNTPELQSCIKAMKSRGCYVDIV